MNPVGTLRRDDLLNVVSDQVEALLAEGGRFAGSQKGYWYAGNRLCTEHFANRIRHRSNMVGHSNVIAWPRPVSSYDGPNLLRHFAYFVFDSR